MAGFKNSHIVLLVTKWELTTTKALSKWKFVRNLKAHYGVQITKGGEWTSHLIRERDMPYFQYLNGTT